MTKALVIGGGVAGLATAAAFQHAGIDATVYEARPGGADGYQLPSLPVWSRAGMTLAGDALHVASPVTTQGASMAIEDAVTLARCLRDLPGTPAALVAPKRTGCTCTTSSGPATRPVSWRPRHPRWRDRKITRPASP